MTSISAIIWGDSDRLARREGGLTVGQVVFPTMNAQARAEVKRIKDKLSIGVTTVEECRKSNEYTPEQERRAHDFLARGKARSKRNAYGLGE
jgi:hypothetical protein